MEYEIGVTAGKVYQFLSSDAPASISEIKKGVEGSKSQVIDMAVGWLAREGKLNFEVRGKQLVISLK